MHPAPHPTLQIQYYYSSMSLSNRKLLLSNKVWVEKKLDFPYYFYFSGHGPFNPILHGARLGTQLTILQFRQLISA